MPLEELKPVLRILLGCVQRSYDPTFRSLCIAIWDALLDKRMGKTVSEACLATLAASTKRVEDGGRTMMCFAWSCKLATAAALKEGGHLSATASFGKLAQMQFLMFFRIAGEGKSEMTRSSAARFSALLCRKAHKGSFDKYVEVLCSCKDPAEVAGGVQLLLSHKDAVAHKTKFIAIYRAAVMDATEGREGRKATPLMTDSFKLLFKMMTHDDFAELVPDVCRVLRRTPELYMSSFAASIVHLSIDTSQYVEKFSSIVTERLSSEKLRADTLMLVSSFAMQSSDLSTLAAMGSEIVKRVSGKDVRNWQERIGLAQGLLELLTLPKGKGIIPLAEEATKVISGLADKEANDETKAAFFAVLGVCLRKTESMPIDVAKVIAKQFESGSDTVRRAAIECIAEAMQANELRSQAGEVVGGLCKLVTTAEKKRGLRGDAILAARTLLTIAPADASAEGEMDKAGFFALLTTPGGYFVEMSHSSSLSTREGVALSDVADFLLGLHVARVKRPADAQCVYSIFAGLLAHPDYGVHSAAAGAIRRTHGNEPATVRGIVDRLHALVRTEGSSDVPKPEADSAAGVPTHISVRFKRALLAAVPGVPPPEMLGQLILVAHSPVMLCGPTARNAQGQAAAWILLANRFPKDNGGFEGAIQRAASSLCEPLLGEIGIRGSAFDRACALEALETLAKYAIDDVLPKVLEAIEGDLDAATVQALTDQDIVIYRTPEGQLARFEELHSGWVAQHICPTPSPACPPFSISCPPLLISARVKGVAVFPCSESLESCPLRPTVSPTWCWRCGRLDRAVSIRPCGCSVCSPRRALPPGAC